MSMGVPMKKTLTDRGIKALKPTAKMSEVSDAIVPGLILRVMPSGAKSFNLIARYPGSTNPTRRSLGAYGVLTLDEARKKARAWLELLGRGVDPAKQVEDERAEADRRRKDTFAAVADEFIRTQVIGPNPAKPIHRCAATYQRDMRNILIPLFGSRPVVELTAREVMPAIELIKEHGTDRALVKLGVRKKLKRPNRPGGPALAQARQQFVFLDGLLRWACDHGGFGLEVSPLAHIKKKARFGQLTRRNRVLSDVELVTAWRAMARLKAPYRQIYQMLTLTGLRLNEVAEAKLDEFDFVKKTWTIPPDRMKGRNDGTAEKHVVPLTTRMLAVLKTVERGPKGKFIFSASLGVTPVAMWGKYKKFLDREMEYDMRVHKFERFTNHDIRRTVRTRLSDPLGVPEEIAEAILAHRKTGMIGIYNRAEHVTARREALEKWGDYLDGLREPGSKPIRKAA
jgi:integrase